MMIAQGLPAGVSPEQIYVFLAIVLSALGVYKLVLSIQVDRKKIATPPSNLNNPQPFVVKEAEVFVKTPDFNKKVSELKTEIGEVEKRIEGKLDKNLEMFRERFHKLSEDLGSISLNAQDLGETSRKEFQRIEGQFGALKATAEHLIASGTQTNQKLDRLIERTPTRGSR